MVYETNRLTWTLMWPCKQTLQAIVCIINYPSSCFPRRSSHDLCKDFDKKSFELYCVNKAQLLWWQRKAFSTAGINTIQTHLLTYFVCKVVVSWVSLKRLFLVSYVCLKMLKKKHFHVLIFFFILIYSLHMQNIRIEMATD